MGRHTMVGVAHGAPLNPAHSRIRARVESHGRLATLALLVVSYACAAASGALLALVAYFTMSASGQLHHEVQLHPTPLPKPQPTSSYDGRGFVAPNKVSRIIMQGPNCWIGVPGATCGSERTFLGE